MKKQLQEKLARLATQLRAIVATAKEDGNRGLTADETIKFNNLEAEYSQTEASIKAIDTVNRIDDDLSKVGKDQIALSMGEDVYGPEAERLNKENKALQDRVFSKFLKYGAQNMSAEETQVLRTQFRGGNPANIRNAQTLTTTGGGYLVPQGFSDQLEEAMKWYGGILGQVDSFTTETGNPLPWPTDNDTSNMGGIIGINTQVPETDITFNEVTFNAYIFTSNSVLVPLALVEDSYFNIDQYLVKKLGTRLGRQANLQFTVGTGAGVAPTGILTAAVAAGNIVQGTTGDTTSFTYNDLVNLLHAVDPAYRMMPSAKFMFNDVSLKVARLLKDTAGRPLWQPGITAGFGNGFPETILDKPYVINNNMPVPAANAYSMLFGALETYKVRNVASGVTVLRLVERYADYLQIGYIGFRRMDGNLIDAGTHPIAVFQNSAN